MASIPYNKINWQNEPNHTTPLSAENLNKMDTAIYDLVTKSNSLVPNPVSAPTEGLEKLEYDGTVYEVKGGHKILNDSGSVLTQMDNMQFNGVYTHNASTITEVDIIREFSTVAEIESLTGEAQKGFQARINGNSYEPFKATDIGFNKTGTSFVSDDVDGVLREIDTELGGSNLKFEVGQFPITYGSNTGNVTGVKITTPSNGRYTIIGTELAGGTLGMAPYVYSSWGDLTTRVYDIKTKTVSVTTNANGVATLDTNDSQEHIISIYAQDRIATHFWVGYGHNNWVKIEKWDDRSPVAETISVTYRYV